MYVQVEKVTKQPETKRITSLKKVNWVEPNENIGDSESVVKKTPSILKTNNQGESIRSVLKSSTNSPASDTLKSQEKPKEAKKVDLINLPPTIERSNENNEDIEYDSDTLKLHAELKKVTNNLWKTHGQNLNLPTASVNDTIAPNKNVSTNNGGGVAVSSENRGNLRILSFKRTFKFQIVNLTLNLKLKCFHDRTTVC